MDIGVGWVATAIWGGGLVVAAFGSLVLLAALFRDRARGRRRCPRCWYDMRGVPGLTCPECGRVATRERQLARTRRRRWRAVLGASIVLVGALAMNAPAMFRDGPLSVVPARVLAHFAPSGWDDQVWNETKQEWELHPVAAEIKRRAEVGRFSAGTWEVLLQRAQVVRTRPVWMENTDAAAFLHLPLWLGVECMYVRTGQEGDEARVVYPVYPREAPANERMMDGDCIIGRLPAGARSFSLAVELQDRVALAAAGDGVTLYKGSLRVPVRATSDPAQVIAADPDIGLDAIVRSELLYMVGEGEIEHRYHPGLSVFLALPEAALKGHAGVGVGVVVELVKNGTVVESHRAVLVPNRFRFTSAVSGAQAPWVSVTFRSMPQGEAYDPEKQGAWALRVRGVSDGLARYILVERHWPGEIVIPMRELVAWKTAAVAREGARSAP